MECIQVKFLSRWCISTITDDNKDNIIPIPENYTPESNLKIWTHNPWPTQLDATALKELKQIDGALQTKMRQQTAGER